MKKLFATATFVFLFFAVGNAQQKENISHKKTQAEGWYSLFDGKTTNGWHVFGAKSAGNFWKVKDGILFPDKENEASYQDSEKRDLVTNKEFGNFELSLEWRISEKGNSGILFYVKDNGSNSETWETGPEMQVLDNGTPIRLGNPDAKNYTHRAGDLYDLLASKEMANPQGEWNKIIIRCKNGKLDFFMNGVHTLHTTLWNDYWNKMVGISKFSTMKDFGKFKSGSIALQWHGGAVWFRNIKIRNL